MKLKNCFVIFILVFVCSATTALASVMEYTNTASFNAAVSGATSYNFEGIAPVNGYSIGNTTVGGVTFADDSPTTFLSSLVTITMVPVPMAALLSSPPQHSFSA